MSTALICIDFINEIVASEGKLAAKGYAEFISRHQTLVNLARLQKFCRDRKIPTFHIRVCFTPGYAEQPKESPLFGKADQLGIMTLGSWGTEFHPQVAPQKEERVIEKHRVSAFYATPLELILRNQKISHLLIAGVATDLAVQSAVRDAHDRDFQITVASDCCAAACDHDHETSLQNLGKLAGILTLDDIIATQPST